MAEEQTGSNDTLQMLDEAPKELTYTLIGIAVAGIAGNIFSSVIWSSDEEKASTSLYLTFLACVDSLYLFSKSIGLLFVLNVGVLSLIRDYKFVFFIVTTMAKFSVYGTSFLTVVVTINRCVALFKPLRYVTLCSRRTAKFLIAFIAILCSLLTLPEIWRNLEGTRMFQDSDGSRKPNSYYYYNMMCFILENIVIYIVPGLVILLLNIVMFFGQKSTHDARTETTGFRATRRKNPMDSIVAIGILFLLSVIVGYPFFYIVSSNFRHFFHFDRFSQFGDLAQYVNDSSKVVFYCTISKKFRALKKSFFSKHRSGKQQAIDVKSYYAPLPWWLAPTESENEATH